jgi:hypothetical protein
MSNGHAVPVVHPRDSLACGEILVKRYAESILVTAQKMLRARVRRRALVIMAEYRDSHPLGPLCDEGALAAIAAVLGPFRQRYEFDLA